jgi:AraC-like DNA-binding protein
LTAPGLAIDRRFDQGPGGGGCWFEFEDLLETWAQPLSHQQIQNLAEAVRLIDADPNQGVATAAAALGLSYSSLYRLFRNLVGLSAARTGRICYE